MFASFTHLFQQNFSCHDGRAGTGVQIAPQLASPMPLYDYATLRPVLLTFLLYDFCFPSRTVIIYGPDGLELMIFDIISKKICNLPCRL